jgi:hypothetical protein
MNVIRHNDKRNELVQVVDSIPMPNGFHNAFSDPRLFEPGRPQRGALKFAVGCNERAPVWAGIQWQGAV